MFYVHNVFTSIQGEGRFTGTPAVFLRLHGCGLCCPFCDTKETWLGGQGVKMPISAVFKALKDEKDKFPQIDHLVITGGEPLHEENGEQLAELLNLAASPFSRIQIETSGVALPTDFLKKMPACTWITVSPKMQSLEDKVFLDTRAELVRMSQEIKFLVDDNVRSSERIEAFLNRVPDKYAGKFICLQPIHFPNNRAKSASAAQYAVYLAKLHGWKVSCQTHKFLNID